MLERNARGRSPEVTGDGDLVENYPSTVMLTWDNPEIHIVRWPLAASGSRRPGCALLAHSHLSSAHLHPPPRLPPPPPLLAPRNNSQIMYLHSNSCLQVFFWRNTNKTAHLSREENKHRGTEYLAQE